MPFFTHFFSKTSAFPSNSKIQFYLFISIYFIQPSVSFSGQTPSQLKQVAKAGTPRHASAGYLWREKPRANTAGAAIPVEVAPVEAAPAVQRPKTTLPSRSDATRLDNGVLISKLPNGIRTVGRMLRDQHQNSYLSGSIIWKGRSRYEGKLARLKNGWFKVDGEAIGYLPSMEPFRTPVQGTVFLGGRNLVLKTKRFAKNRMSDEGEMVLHREQWHPHGKGAVDLSDSAKLEGEFFVQDNTPAFHGKLVEKTPSQGARTDYEGDMQYIRGRWIPYGKGRQSLASGVIMDGTFSVLEDTPTFRGNYFRKGHLTYTGEMKRLSGKWVHYGEGTQFLESGVKVTGNFSIEDGRETVFGKITSESLSYKGKAQIVGTAWAPTGRGTLNTPDNTRLKGVFSFDAEKNRSLFNGKLHFNDTLVYEGNMTALPPHNLANWSPDGKGKLYSTHGLLIGTYKVDPVSGLTFKGHHLHTKGKKGKQEVYFGRMSFLFEKMLTPDGKGTLLLGKIGKYRGVFSYHVHHRGSYTYASKGGRFKPKGGTRTKADVAVTHPKQGTPMVTLKVGDGPEEEFPLYLLNERTAPSLREASKESSPQHRPSKESSPQHRPSKATFPLFLAGPP